MKWFQWTDDTTPEMPTTDYPADMNTEAIGDSSDLRASTEPENTYGEHNSSWFYILTGRIFGEDEEVQR